MMCRALLGLFDRNYLNKFNPHSTLLAYYNVCSGLYNNISGILDVKSGVHAVVYIVLALVC